MNQKIKHLKLSKTMQKKNNVIYKSVAQGKTTFGDAKCETL